MPLVAIVKNRLHLVNNSSIVGLDRTRGQLKIRHTCRRLQENFNAYIWVHPRINDRRSA